MVPRLDAGSGYGFVRLNHIDSKMSTTADIRNKWIDRDFVSVTDMKLQQYKDTRGGPVLWMKKIFTETWGDCHPVPPTP